MARVHFVKSARKDNSVAKKGESYYWWQHAFQPKQLSKNQPTRSQIQSSAFLAELYELEDTKPNPEFDADNIQSCFDDLQSAIEEHIGSIEDLKDQCEESLQNMPEHLQEQSSTGELLQERIDALEQYLSELQSISISYDENQSVKELEDLFTDCVQEFHEASSGV